MRWIFGAAGVGKSAIMQNIAESPNLPVTSHSSVFFSVDGRNDGIKAIKTISYQFAVKSESYRQLVEQEVARDPSLLQSSMAVQFKNLIVKPFIHNTQLNSAGRFLVIIDGLDECNKRHSQQELLRLISDFCITYPSSPLVWLIASRPEPLITSFFARTNVLVAYEKEEILVDSDNSREDVERFLRHELAEIKEASDSLDPHSPWPAEQDLWKIADAAGGLFAYADTVVKYIGDSAIGDPASQLSDVLHVIDNFPMTNVPREEHPMALLDALYARILSNIPSKVMINTRKLLLALAIDWSSNLEFGEKPFIVLCNWLALTADEAYAVVNHLRSVLRVPGRDQAHEKALTPIHKSFIDYLSDFNRSGFSHDVMNESKAQYATFRILKEAANGIDFGQMNYGFRYGSLRRGPGIGDKISLTWPVDEGVPWSDEKTRLSVYKLAVGEVVAAMERGESIFQSQFCIRLLASRFAHYSIPFPHETLCDLVFDESRRHELLMHGMLKQMPLIAVNTSEIIPDVRVKLWFRRSGTTVTKISDPWNPSCNHERNGQWEEGRNQHWLTTFDEALCRFCFERLKHQLGSWKAQYPNHTVSTLFTSAGECPIEIKFVDVKDGIMSEWTYSFWLQLTRRERNKYGSIV